MLPKNAIKHASIPMARPSVLADAARLGALCDTALMDSESEEAFDRLTRVAATALNAATALVSLVDVDRQYFKSCSGMNMGRQSTLEYSFCQHVVDRAEPLVVANAATHLLVATNLAHVELGIHAYLGVPLITADGHTIGSFCVLDHEPREWNDTHLAVMRDLAASVMTEIELRAQTRRLDASELKFRSIAESSQEAIVATDENGVVTFWNDGAFAAFGWTSEEMMGRSLATIMPAAPRQRPESRMKRLLASASARGVGHRVEHTGVRKDGVEFPLELTLGSWTSQGRTAFCGVLRDLTSIRRSLAMEQEFERQHEFLTAVLENLTEGIVACDAEGNLTIFNRATREMHGLPEAPVPRSQWAEHYDLYLADGKTLMTVDQIPLVRALSGEVVESVEFVIAPKGRPPLTVISNGRALRRPDGSLLGAVVAMFDVTEARRVAAERDRLVEILECTPDFVGQTSPDGKLHYLNPAARRMMGVAPDASLSGIHAQALHPPNVMTSLEREAYPAMLRDGSWAGDSVLIADGGRYVPMWQVLIPHRAASGGVEYLSTVMRDMTAAKANEAQLRAAQQQAERANLAKSAFLSRASHELRTPLNAVIGFAGILLKNRRGTLGSEELEFAARIARNGKHLLSLVDDLHDLSKIEAERMDLELSPVSLFDLVYEVQDSLSSRALEFGLMLAVDLPDTADTGADLTIITDEKRLRQVLINLAGNAVKYTRDGAVAIRVIADPGGCPIRIDVADTGPGISTEEMSSIFEPFVVGGAMARGDVSTGLGLSITQALCILLGYRLTVQSVVGEGTTFSVHLNSLREALLLK